MGDASGGEDTTGVSSVRWALLTRMTVTAVPLSVLRVRRTGYRETRFYARVVERQTRPP